MMNSVTNTMDNDAASERMRFESFKLGGPASTTTNTVLKPTHRHVRSRSRNLSVSTSFSVPAPSADVSPVSPTFPGQPGAQANLSPVPASKRNSHHRRRSSVSTRHESADLMGVSVANLPLSVSDDNINLGEMDSVRRRALWVLEGKPDLNTFSKVEIPDIGTPELSTKKFEFSTKPPLPVLGSTFGNAVGKRDSFGKHLTATTSSKEQLHTLVEEDEEEGEEECEDDSIIVLSPVELSSPIGIASKSVEVMDTTPALQRHRPAHLNLHQLALGKENFSLPTPSTPTPRSSTGLRSLTLATSPVPITSIGGNEGSTNTNRMKRHSVMVPSVSPVITPARRASLDLEGSFRSSSSFQTDSAQKRRSISYKHSVDIPSKQLPTPALTPTIENRPTSASSTSSLASVSDRCMSETEQHFLYQAHATLTQRITDLERALAASQPHSRPVSCASEASGRSSMCSPIPKEPSDEMLQLIADLKAERDELNKDVEGWRVRVSDLERQVGVLSQRVDLERREAWVARQRTGLLEVEKGGIQKSLEAMGAELQAALARCDVSRVEAEVLKEECERLREDLRAKSSLEEEFQKLRVELDEERKKRVDLEIALKASIESHINRRAPAFSIDSQVTDVEYSPIEDFKTALRSVAEEENEDYSGDYSEDYSDQDDELANYEQADDDDDTFSSQISAISSIEDVSRSVSALRAEIAAAPIPPSHSRRASLVKAWTFPSGSQGDVPNPKPTEVDKFFGCLEYDEDEEVSAAVHAAITGDSGKGLFSQGLLVDDEDFPPFLIPAQTGFEVAEKPSLGVIEESEEEEEEEPVRTPYEDDFGGEVVEGGIIFTFTPPEDSDVSSELATPSPPRSASSSPRVFSHSQDDEAPILPFKLSQVAALPVTPPHKPFGIATTPGTPNSPLRKNSPPTPSSIPRAVVLKSYAANTPTKASPLERIVLNRSNTFSTPPSKHSSPTTTTAFQAQSTASSKPSPPSFIRQPQRSSTLPTRPMNEVPNTHRLFNPNPPTSEGVMVDPTPSSKTSAPPTDSRISKLSFQTFTKLIPSPFSWSSRSTPSPQTSLPIRESESRVSLSRSSTDSADRSFVSKEKQLEKLRSRMEGEARMRVRARA